MFFPFSPYLYFLWKKFFRNSLELHFNFTLPTYCAEALGYLKSLLTHQPEDMFLFTNNSVTEKRVMSIY